VKDHQTAEEREKGLEDDRRTLEKLGYAQELLRRMSGFSNYAISLSIICILAGGITSFHLGLSSVGGASIGLGWPLVCLFSLVVALAMGQVASAFPTAGGLYHWASILGGRGWGWATGWFNLAGLITVLAAVNVGTYGFVLGSLGPVLGLDPGDWGADKPKGFALQLAGVSAITITHAIFNHRGIKLTTRLTDLSGYLILVVTCLLTAALLIYAPSFDPARLVTFQNLSGARGGAVWPETTNLPWLFALGFLLPAYTVTGFDASAHVSEETVGAARNVPRGIIRSVWVSGLFGWILLAAIVLALPSVETGAAQGSQVFYWLMNTVLPGWLAALLSVGIALAQYLCGLAIVTSASRMMYAFSRDGGLPFSDYFRKVNDRHKTPVLAIWSVAGLAILFTLYTPVYSTITIVCTTFLYISYAIPILLGFFAHGRRWTQMGPFHLGRWYKPLALISALGCGVLLAIGMAPPNDIAIWIVGAVAAGLLIYWHAVERRRFRGPPMIQIGAEPMRAADARISSSSNEP
jgi:amino acid transporter